MTCPYHTTQALVDAATGRPQVIETVTYYSLLNETQIRELGIMLGGGMKLVVKNRMFILPPKIFSTEKTCY